MSDFLSKLSSYNILNYLFPGTVSCWFADSQFGYSLIQENIIVGLFLYYFVGMVISRIGSLLIEPVFRWCGFVKNVDYRRFVRASQMDEKVNVLSEMNNVYRTVIAMLVTLAALGGYREISNSYPELQSWNIPILMVILTLMFGAAYRKQSDYIVKRIENVESAENGDEV